MVVAVRILSWMRPRASGGARTATHPTTHRDAVFPPDDVQAPRSAASADNLPALFVVNLAALVVVGTSILFWIYHYTDWFPAVATFLGLGGILAWAALLVNLVSEVRKQQIQAWIDRRLLQSHRTWGIALCLLALGLLVSSLFGTVVVRAGESSLGHTLRVARLNEAGEREVPNGGRRLTAGQETKHLVSAGWGGRDYWVKVSGFPARKVHVAPWGQEKLEVPNSFLSRPVLLVRASPELGGNLERSAAADPLTLSVEINGKPVGSVSRYVGELVWVGCESDVNVPKQRWDFWRLELAAEGIPEVVMARWAKRSSVGPETILSPGDEVKVAVLRKDGVPVAERVVVIKELVDADEFPQEVTVDVPSSS